MLDFKVSIVAGIEYDHDNCVLNETFQSDAIEKIREYLCIQCGGFTEVDTYGGWFNENNVLVCENGKQWDIAICPGAACNQGIAGKIESIAYFILHALAQQSVVIHLPQQTFFVEYLSDGSLIDRISSALNKQA